MRTVVVDTNIIIDHTRRKSKDLINLVKKTGISLYFPSVVVFELHVGLEMSSAAKQETMDALLKSGYLYAFDEKIARLAAKLAREDKVSTKLADLFVAATALYLGAELATHNRRHFKGIPGLKFFDFKKV